MASIRRWTNHSGNLGSEQSPPLGKNSFTKIVLTFKLKSIAKVVSKIV